MLIITLPAWARWLLRTVAFLAIGCTFYTLYEQKDCESLTAACTCHEDTCTEPWTVIDSLYFCMVTMSTVGYGDLTPSTDVGRLFTFFYIFVGITMVFSSISGVLSGVLLVVEQRFLGLIDRFDQARANVAGRQVGLSGAGVDLNGNGTADFYEPPGATVFWIQRLGPWILVLVGFQCLFAWIYQLTEPGLSYDEAFWHCFVTATTVGYGDVRLTRQASRLWAFFHIAISVAWFAALIGRCHQLCSVRRAEFQLAAALKQEINQDLLMKLDRDAGGDGQSVSKLVFVVGMMMQAQMEFCGEPLAWKHIQPFLAIFEGADKRADGFLDQEDLKILEDARARKVAGKQEFSRIAPT